MKMDDYEGHFLDFTNWADVRICNTKNQGIVDEFCERILKNKKARVCISQGQTTTPPASTLSGYGFYVKGWYEIWDKKFRNFGF